MWLLESEPSLGASVWGVNYSVPMMVIITHLLFSLSIFFLSGFIWLSSGDIVFPQTDTIPVFIEFRDLVEEIWTNSVVTQVSVCVSVCVWDTYAFMQRHVQNGTSLFIGNSCWAVRLLLYETLQSNCKSRKGAIMYSVIYLSISFTFSCIFPSFLLTGVDPKDHFS